MIYILLVSTHRADHWNNYTALLTGLPSNMMTYQIDFLIFPVNLSTVSFSQIHFLPFKVIISHLCFPQLLTPPSLSLLSASADCLPGLLRDLCAGQEATVRADMETDWFQRGNGVLQGCILSPCSFNSYAEYIMRNAGLVEAQAGIKIAGRNINNLRFADDTTLMAEREEELKSLLMKVKVESEEVGLRFNTQKTKIMASGPITSWEVDGETVETVSDFIFLGSKITADGDCSHEIKRCLLLGRKVMTNLDSILKSRDITLPTKVRLVKAMVFPVVMYGCESRTVKKDER